MLNHDPSFASVRSIPRASSFTGKNDPSSPAELMTMVAKVVKDEHERYLLENIQ
jgi:hypothetical protein